MAERRVGPKLHAPPFGLRATSYLVNPGFRGNRFSELRRALIWNPSPFPAKQLAAAILFDRVSTESVLTQHLILEVVRVYAHSMLSLPFSEIATSPPGVQIHFRWSFAANPSQTSANNAASVGLTARIREVMIIPIVSPTQSEYKQPSPHPCSVGILRFSLQMMHL